MPIRGIRGGRGRRRYWGTSLGDVFRHSDYRRWNCFNIGNFNSKNYLEVKIIKEVSPTEYKVADATGFRHIDLEIELLDSSEWRPNKMLLQENNFVKIKGYGIDFESKKVILKQKTKITKIEEFWVDPGRTELTFRPPWVDQNHAASNVSTILAVLSTLVVVNFEKNF